MEVLQRIGYGASFNELTIKDNIILKKTITEYGKNKIKKEIEFYKFLEKNRINFPKPRIIYYLENEYCMEYLKNTQQLYKIFGNYSQNKKNSIINTIYDKLNILHENTIKINKNILMDAIYKECYQKIMNRHIEIINILDKYNTITTVNNIKINTFIDTVKIIYNKIKKICENSEINTFSCIHGDCQFNNILIDESNDELYFIDPRGYFGSMDIYGLKEYDYAKVKFALTGYDVFDNMYVDILDINENNINIPNIFLTSDIFSDCSELVKLLTLSIWLGNAHSFKNNEKKVIYSYFYALYLCKIFN
jgi:hypothetical protein